LTIIYQHHDAKRVVSSLLSYMGIDYSQLGEPLGDLKLTSSPYLSNSKQIHCLYIACLCDAVEPNPQVLAQVVDIIQSKRFKAISSSQLRIVSVLFLVFKTNVEIIK
jgi:hypothetical protein